MSSTHAAPSRLDLLAIRTGTALERWGRARADRRAARAAAAAASVADSIAGHVDPREQQRLRAELEASRAHADTLLMRIR